MKKSTFLLLGLLSVGSIQAQQVVTDSLQMVDLEEVLVVSSPKESRKFREQALASSLVSPSDLQNKQLVSLKNISAYIPNFVMPDYGSRLTSSIYIRGIGSRINSPAVGMYVDNIPYLDKSAYDISLFGVERVDVLRGPQGTLYGKNTMGGLIRVYTRNPFLYQGTDVKLSAATKNGQWSTSVMQNMKVNNRFAFSLGGYYEGADGFFMNEGLNKKVDAQKAGGARTRMIYKPSDVLSFDFTASYDNSDEGGYAYGFLNTETGKIGPVSTNRENSYRRSVLNLGLNVEADLQHLTFNSITGFQGLKDRMFMDQDYSVADVFTLEQKQKLRAFTQEFTFKNKGTEAWQWTTGAFFSHQSLHTSAPVTFHQDGMNMLTQSINGYFPESISGMTLDFKFQTPTMPIPADFDTPVNTFALFHQSNVNFGRWTLTLGGRLEHERMKNLYNVSSEAAYLFTASYRGMPIPVKEVAVSRLAGELKDDYTKFLPKLALVYRLNRKNNLYASVSKGYRSGGYNLQMISDVAQVDLQNSMFSQIKTGVTAGFQKYVALGMPAAMVNRIVEAMSVYMKEKDIDVKSAITYKPEISWNYEVGSHFSLADGRILGDADVFYMRIKDQQITRFVNSGLGRILVNAGKTESYGAELSLRGQLSNNFSLSGTFGYTHATFKEYDTASEGADGADYTGNHVPYVPAYTYSLSGDYRIPAHGWLHNVFLGANILGSGKVYWNEDNLQYQKAYAQLGGHVMFDFGKISLDIWGKNLTDVQYNTFCFKNGNTASSKYIGQRGKPMQLGVDLRFHF